MTERLPSAAELADFAQKLLENFPLNRWHGKARQAITKLQAEKIAVACSGGADSTFALMMIYAAFPQCRERIQVLHFNHRLRSDSDEDENFVLNLAKRLGLSCSTFRPECRNQTKVDEGTLREQRLNSFLDLCKTSDTGLIVQGHNQDDVAETIIWRLSRGSSPQGLCAPRPVHKHGQVHIVRPFLAISREEIRSGLADVKMTWREDSTNQSSSYLRNRIRMNGLRLLKQDVDRDLLGGMSRSRDLLEEQEDAMKEWTVLAQDKCLKEGKLDTIELKTVPVAIRRRIIYNWISAEINPNALSPNQMEQILKSVASDEKLDLSISPDRKVMLSENRLLVKVKKPDSAGWTLCAFARNQALFLPDGKFIRFSTKTTTPALIQRILEGQVDASKEAYLVPKGRIPVSLFCRTRIPGDSYKPLGAPGSKKIKNWMIDRKLEPSERESLPLTIDSKGQIIWVPGLPPAETHRVQHGVKEVIHLTYGLSATLL